MTERVKLAVVFGWIDTRMADGARVERPTQHAGCHVRQWCPSLDYHGSALRLLPDAAAIIDAWRNTAQVRIDLPARGIMLLTVSRDAYTEGEIELSGLVSYCDFALGPPKASESRPASKLAGGPGPTEKYDWAGGSMRRTTWPICWRSTVMRIRPAIAWIAMATAQRAALDSRGNAGRAKYGGQTLLALELARTVAEGSSCASRSLRVTAAGW